MTFIVVCFARAVKRNARKGKAEDIENFFGKKCRRDGRMIKKSQIKIKKGQKKCLHFKNVRVKMVFRKVK